VGFANRHRQPASRTIAQAMTRHRVSPNGRAISAFDNPPTLAKRPATACHSFIGARFRFTILAQQKNLLEEYW
jgi:hypothetical protein